MTTIESRPLWFLAFLAMSFGLAGCDAPLAPVADLQNPTVARSAQPPEHARAGIPIHTTVVAELATIGACTADPDAARLTLVGSGQAAGLGPYELEYSYCPTAVGVIDLAVILRTRAGELWMVGNDEPGQIVPSDHPDFDVEAHATWRIIGGTQKFEGASGELQADLFAELPATPTSLAITTMLSGTIGMAAG